MPSLRSYLALASAFAVSLGGCSASSQASPMEDVQAMEMDKPAGDGGSEPPMGDGDAPAEDESDLPPGHEEQEPADEPGDRDRPAGGDVADLRNCPETEPVADTECGDGPLLCTYGDGLRPECRGRWRCNDGLWADGREQPCSMVPDGYCAEGGNLEGSCEPLDADGAGKEHGNGEVSCGYDDGQVCLCLECLLGSCTASHEWTCTASPELEDERCPTTLPNIGGPCAENGIACDYGDPCVAGGLRICRNGVWYPRSTSCSD